MTIEHAEELAGMQRVGRLVSRTIGVLRDALRPGITTGALDALAARELRRAGAVSAPMTLVDFPASVCICVNEEVVHGVPGARVVREGDLVTLDVTPILDGYCADAAVTVPVGRPSPDAARLLAAAQRCLHGAIGVARAGRPLRDIGATTERIGRAAGVTVYPELGGHGVGRSMHEPPSVPNVDVPRLRGRLHDGLVLAIEPIVGLGGTELVTRDDGWTMATVDGSLSAHVERTVVVGRRGARVLTAA